ncbi:MAG: transposase [Planctomycetales bacterium]|nr:transposase [bacterium]UNM09968.1 MAG: transposase [Planctomycetales bacterium]
MKFDGHRGFYKSQRLPHFDSAGLIQFVTIALADAAPKTRKPLTAGSKQNSDQQFMEMDSILDTSRGVCLFRMPRLAWIAGDLARQGEYLGCIPLAWVIMPNHAHLLFGQTKGTMLSEVVRKFKGRSAYLINAETGKSGKVWQKGYFDRAMRDLNHFAATLEYIHENPVKAGLASRAEDWKQSSIHDTSLELAISVIEQKGLLSVS